MCAVPKSSRKEGVYLLLLFNNLQPRQQQQQRQHLLHLKVCVIALAIIRSHFSFFSFTSSLTAVFLFLLSLHHRHLLSSASLHTHTLIYSESLCAGVAVSFRRDRLHFGALHSSSNSQTGTHLLKKYSFAISYTNSALSPSISLLETRCALPLLLTLLCPDLIRASPIADWLSVTI